MGGGGPTPLLRGKGLTSSSLQHNQHRGNIASGIPPCSSTLGLARTSGSLGFNGQRTPPTANSLRFGATPHRPLSASVHGQALSAASSGGGHIQAALGQSSDFSGFMPSGHGLGTGGHTPRAATTGFVRVPDSSLNVERGIILSALSSNPSHPPSSLADWVQPQIDEVGSVGSTPTLGTEEAAHRRRVAGIQRNEERALRWETLGQVYPHLNHFTTPEPSLHPPSSQISHANPDYTPGMALASVYHDQQVMLDFRNLGSFIPSDSEGDGAPEEQDAGFWAAMTDRPTPYDEAGDDVRGSFSMAYESQSQVVGHTFDLEQLLEQDAIFQLARDQMGGDWEAHAPSNQSDADPQRQKSPFSHDHVLDTPY